MAEDYCRQIVEQAKAATTRVYDVGAVTPLQQIDYNGINLYIKREDISPINAYKWRGAYNKICLLSDEEKQRGIIAASAGNHAQGVAIGARRIGVKAKIFMPVSTPQMKQQAVAKHGGDAVEIVLYGDDYNEAAAKSLAVAELEQGTYVHPYDDIHTIAGQATMGLEMLEFGPFDYAFIQIGGGGMGAGVSAILKDAYPDIKIIGVEGVDQASMKAAIAAGKPVRLEKIDAFCDGTAVNKAGEINFAVCKETLDEIITVTNDEVCAGVKWLWDHQRCIPEPSGAMGIAALNKYDQSKLTGKKVVVIVCGANMDFNQLGWISRHAGIGTYQRHYVRLSINEQSGSLLGIIDQHCDDLSVTEFQYGKTNETTGYPVIAFDASPARFVKLQKDLTAAGVTFEDVTNRADVEFKIINYNPQLFKNPLFYRCQFPERKGALRDFLHQIKGVANICYFNYSYSGESIGRALMGFEFADKQDQNKFRDILKNAVIQTNEIAAETAQRILAAG